MSGPGRWRPATLLGLTLALLAPRLQAGNNTYCVGGRDACNQPAVRALHARWHFHTFVSDGDRCFECYDERDNTCVTDFLQNHPDWTVVAPVVCDTVMEHAGLAEGVRFHRIGGEEVAPPPPTPIELTAQVGALPVGPFAAGDEVRIPVRLRAGDGTERSFSGGRVELLDASGTVVAEAPVTGSEARLELPAAGRYALRFDPGQIDLDDSERLEDQQQPLGSIEVGACRFRARLQQPVAGWRGVPGAQLDIIAGLLDQQGASASAPPGLIARARLTRASGPPIDVPLTLDADGLLRGSLPVPGAPAEDEEPGWLTVSGEAGASAVCAGPEVELTLAPLPISLRAESAAWCYQGRPCPVTLVLEAEPGHEVLLEDPALTVEATVAGSPAEPQPLGAGRFRLDPVPDLPGLLHVELGVSVMAQPLGGDAVGASRRTVEHAVEVREAVALAAPPVLELGSLDHAALREQRCAELDLSASRGLAGQRFELSLAQPGCDCGDEVGVPSGGATHLLDGTGANPVVWEFREGLTVPLCVELAACPAGGEGEARVRIRSLVPEFPDEEVEAVLRYRVEARSWWSCYRVPLALGGGSLLLLIGILGWMLPRSFESDTRIRYARDLKRLPRARPRRLRDLPGGTRGWYRSARVYLSGSGDALRTPRGARVTLRPSPAGLVLVARGLERQDRRSRRWVAEEGAADGVAARRNVPYRVGDLVLVVM